MTLFCRKGVLGKRSRHLSLREALEYLEMGTCTEMEVPYIAIATFIVLRKSFSIKVVAI